MFMRFRQAIMDFLEQLAPPDQDSGWLKLCYLIDAEFIPSPIWGSARVVKRLTGWSIVFDTFTTRDNDDDPITHTRIRALYNNQDGFWFSLQPRSTFADVMKHLGLHDVEVGDPDFDRAFVIQGNDAVKLRTLFANDRIRQLIQLQPTTHLEVKHYERLIPEFPGGIDELVFQVPWQVSDPELLKVFYDLFVEVLNQMCQLGSASEDDPGVTL